MAIICKGIRIWRGVVKKRKIKFRIDGGGGGGLFRIGGEKGGGGQ